MNFFDDLTVTPIEVSSPVTDVTKPAFKPHAKFSPEDDEMLRRLVEEFGENNWNIIADRMPGRNIRQVKERWSYYLSPNLNRTPWTKEEDELLIEKQKELGSRWVRISQFFQNRTDAMVKNRFQVLKRKEQKEKEIQARREKFLAQASSPCMSPPTVTPEVAPSPVDDQPYFENFGTTDPFSIFEFEDFGLVF